MNLLATLEPGASSSRIDFSDRSPGTSVDQALPESSFSSALNRATNATEEKTRTDENPRSEKAEKKNAHPEEKGEKKDEAVSGSSEIKKEASEANGKSEKKPDTLKEKNSEITAEGEKEKSSVQNRVPVPEKKGAGKKETEEAASEKKKNGNRMEGGNESFFLSTIEALTSRFASL